MIRPERVGDDGLDGTLGEGALNGFELELQVEWVELLERRASSRAACCDRQPLASKRRYSVWAVVVAAGYACAEAGLLRQSAHRM